jgi:hypothetical protein
MIGPAFSMVFHARIVDTNETTSDTENTRAIVVMIWERFILTPCLVMVWLSPLGGVVLIPLLQTYLRLPFCSMGFTRYGLTKTRRFLPAAKELLLLVFFLTTIPSVNTISEQ